MATESKPQDAPATQPPAVPVAGEAAKTEPPKPEAPKTEATTAEAIKKEDSDEEEAPELGKQDAGKAERKVNKGEKKCKKALLKLGMKPVTGITRVTIKKSDEVVFAISNPDVLKSATNDNCYVVFG